MTGSPIDAAQGKADAPSSADSWRRVVSWSLVVWLSVGFLRGALRLAFHLAPTVTLTVGYGVFYDAYWILVTPILWQLSRWTRAVHRVRVPRYCVLAAASFSAGLGFALWMMVAAKVFFGRHLPFSTAVLRVSDTALLNIAGILTCAFAVQAYHGFRRGRSAAIQLARELHDAHLQMLTSQLHPHFLFNTLHLVSEVVRADRAAATTIIRNLEYLLAQAAAYSHHREVPLEAELAFLESYIQIQERRFRGRLVVRLEAAPSLTNALVPHLLLQPLVENAIKHGIGARRGTGHVVVTATVAPDDRNLRLQVVDDGVGFPSAPPSGGIGLRNTRLRLDRLYGSSYQLRIEAAQPTGTKILIDLPRKDTNSADSQNRYQTRSGPDRMAQADAADNEHTLTPRWLSTVLHPITAAFMIVAGWIVVALVWTTIGKSLNSQSGATPSLLASLDVNFANAAVWCVLTPLVVWIARRIRMRGAATPPKAEGSTSLEPATALVAHAAAAAVVAELHLAAWARLAVVLGLPAVTARSAPPVTWLLWDVGAYLLIAAATHLYDYVRWANESLAETARLSAEAANARERIVRLRLQPRVLSTVLRTLGRLANSDAELCDEAILRAGDFLRALLRSSASMESTVGTEVLLTLAFLEVMHVGAEERWSFAIDVEPRLDECAVPPGSLLAIIATLADNTSALRRRLDVSARTSDDNRGIVCEVSAWYGGDASDVAEHFRELHTLRARWSEAGGEPHAMTIHTGAHGGVRVRFQVLKRENLRHEQPTPPMKVVA